MIEINRAKAIQLLEEAVNERGQDFVYTWPVKMATDGDGAPVTEHGCWYEVDGAPSCGVGWALHLAEVPTTVLNALDQAAGDTTIDGVAWILEDSGIRLTQEAVRVFGTFQRYQDMSYPWGKALEVAKED